MIILDRTTWATIVSAWGLKIMGWLNIASVSDALQLVVTLATLTLVYYNIRYKRKLMQQMDKEENKDDKI